MNTEIYFAVLAALCTYKVLDLISSWANKPEKPRIEIERSVEVRNADELPDFVKQAIIRKLKGEDDDK